MALEYLHKNGIVHRDVKPENLIFDRRGYIHLADLGISRLVEKGKKLVDSSGTPGYMAPEIITNINHGPCSDFFSAGVMLYELALGNRPYKGKTRREIKEVMFSREINISEKELPEGWSACYSDLVNRLLARKPSDRIGFKKGVTEIKEHEFFKGYNWNKLYAGLIPSPFKPKLSGNYDEKYVNKADKIEAYSYNKTMAKIVEKKYFMDYYFNRHEENEEKFFKLNGASFRFNNCHENEEELKSTSTTTQNKLPVNRLNLLLNKK